MKHCVSVRQNSPQGTVQTASCFSATAHISKYMPFLFLRKFSRRVNQDQVRPLLHFQNYASYNENGCSLNLMFPGTKDCHIPSLSDTLFSLPHRGNLGMYKCFCKIYSIVFRFSDRNVSIWREIRAYFKRINHWPSSSDFTEVERVFNASLWQCSIRHCEYSTSCYLT